MKKLVILAQGPSKVKCPYNDTEIWATAHGIQDVPLEHLGKVTKAFAFDFQNESKGLTENLQYCREHKIPISSFLDYADEEYPVKDIRRNYQNPLLWNTVSYMLAFAIHQGYEVIDLYGVDQGPEWEYLAAKPYVTYWLGVADAKEIQVYSHSDILFEPFLNVVRDRKLVTRIPRADIHSKVRVHIKAADNL